MTEYGLYVSCIPTIAEIVARCRGMERQQYEEWKRETVESTPETVKGYIRRVLNVIDSCVLGGAHLTR